MSREFLVHVQTNYKSEIRDPQANAIADALGRKGHEVVNLRAGKAYDFRITASSKKDARAQVTVFSDGFLANPVIEDFKIKVKHAEPFYKRWRKALTWRRK